jgi:hypothetical protein
MGKSDDGGVRHQFEPNATTPQQATLFLEVATMKRVLLWLIVAAVLEIGFLLYWTRPGDDLNVDPHAREVIEKAKQR